MNRDFKGVWIPKEIWLNEELSMLEKVLFTEISSLDNEEHCSAGNEYFAKFCNCSESAITKAIKHLKDLKMIEILSFDGRHRKLKVLEFTKQPNKIYESESYNLLPNNINSNISTYVDNYTNTKVLDNTNKNNTKVLLEETKPKRKNLYEKCLDEIDEHTGNIKLRNILTDYLKLRLEMKDKPLYFNQWKGLLKKLNTLANSNEEQIQIVELSIEKGWGTFVELPSKNTVNNRPWNKNVNSEPYDKNKLAKKEKEMKDSGLQTRF